MIYLRNHINVSLIPALSGGKKPPKGRGKLKEWQGRTIASILALGIWSFTQVCPSVIYLGI